MHDLVQLQIESVEARTEREAICIVRCLKGVAHPGQDFSLPEQPQSDDANSRNIVTLTWIDRYGAQVDFLDASHSAKIHLDGSGFEALRAGVIISSSM